MTIKEVEELAKILHKRVLEAYYKNPDLLYQEILDKYMEQFNKEIAKQLNEEIDKIMNAGISALSIVTAPLTGIPLSQTLYKNSQYVAKESMKVINKHLANKSTINEIREALYDGYGYGGIENIKQAVKLPKYLLDKLDEASIMRLKTKPLKSAYMKLLEDLNDKQFEKALKVAIEEKARYYALRIAHTEEQRAFNLANADEMLKDDVEFVKFQMSSLHKMRCVCDFYALQDVGYGAGIYPIKSAPMPIYSSHPFCMCKLVRKEVMKRFRPVANPRESALNNFTKTVQNSIRKRLMINQMVKVEDVFMI